MTSGEHFNNSPSNFGSQEAPLLMRILGRREQCVEDKGF
jgi:hypothetical protein